MLARKLLERLALLLAPSLRLTLLVLALLALLLRPPHLLLFGALGLTAHARRRFLLFVRFAQLMLLRTVYFLVLLAVHLSLLCKSAHRKGENA
ncbi:MAG TPA: hypothetical protein VLT59_03055 [Steroidobacteraceae bacterium]|nr:hypothetical protein [Steroidobacteraceae bacterium]